MQSITQKPILSTLSELISLGYTRGERIKYRGFIIYPKDTSGHNKVGYSYAIGVDSSNVISWYMPGFDKIESRFDLLPRTFGSTETVWLDQEKNLMHQLGCFVVRFLPDVWEQGVTQAKIAIDEWLLRSPLARAAIEEDERELKAIAQRQAAKAAQRQAARRQAA